MRTINDAYTVMGNLPRETYLKKKSCSLPPVAITCQIVQLWNTLCDPLLWMLDYLLDSSYAGHVQRSCLQWIRKLNVPFTCIRLFHTSSSRHLGLKNFPTTHCWSMIFSSNICNILENDSYSWRCWKCAWVFLYFDRIPSIFR